MPLPPPRVMPPVEIPAAPLPANRQYVVLDTPGESAEVTASTNIGVTAGGWDVSRSKKLCITPCVTDLRVGQHDLFFASTANDHSSQVTVEVGDGPLVVRQVMAESLITPHEAAESKTGFGLGFAAFFGLLGGTVLTPIGAGLDVNGLEYAGIAVLGVSAALLVTGIVLAHDGRGRHIAGVTTQWSLPPRLPLETPPSPAGPVGCSMDTNCKGDRICVQGQCTDPPAKAAPAPP